MALLKIATNIQALGEFKESDFEKKHINISYCLHVFKYQIIDVFIWSQRK